MHGTPAGGVAIGVGILNSGFTLDAPCSDWDHAAWAKASTTSARAQLISSFVCKNVCTALIEWLSGGTDGYVPMVSARFLELGWAFFVLIVLSAYTCVYACDPCASRGVHQYW